MNPIDIQVSRSKVKVKGHASLLHLVQLITQERFAQEASNLVGRKSLMSRWPLSIFRLVGQRSSLFSLFYSFYVWSVITYGLDINTQVSCNNCLYVFARKFNILQILRKIYARTPTKHNPRTKQRLDCSHLYKCEKNEQDFYTSLYMCMKNINITFPSAFELSIALVFNKTPST